MVNFSSRRGIAVSKEIFKNKPVILLIENVAFFASRGILKYLPE